MIRIVRAAVVATALALVAPLGAEVFVVDHGGTGQFDTIQEGLDTAAEGDTILVLPGTYQGDGNRDLSFGTKNVVLRGSPLEPLDTVIDCQNATGHRGINFVLTGQDSTCVVDGFTITGGRFADANSSGAGIRCEWASPKLMNLRLVDNHISGGGKGGGLYCNNSAFPVVRDVTFHSNAAYDGGGMYVTMGSAPIVNGARFTGNTATVGPGRGGGMYCGLDSSPTIRNATFVDNAAGREGGGIFCWRSSPALDNVTFLGNSATLRGGALSCDDNASPTLTQVTFALNHAPDGGSIYLIDTSSPTIEGCILSFTTEGGAIACEGGSNPTITSSCIFGNVGGDNLCGAHSDNITVDPLFCDVTADDLGLAADSPCLPPGNPWEVRMGSHGQECTVSPVDHSSWGRIKSGYRR
jgi:predicted outer membrane repeat protein